MYSRIGSPVYYAPNIIIYETRVERQYVQFSAVK